MDVVRQWKHLYVLKVRLCVVNYRVEAMRGHLEIHMNGQCFQAIRFITTETLLHISCKRISAAKLCCTNKRKYAHRGMFHFSSETSRSRW